MFRRCGAAKLPGARKRQPRVNAKSTENFLVAGEHVAESRELAGRALCQRHAAGAAAGAVTERSRLQHKDGPSGSKGAQPSRSGKTGEAAANNGEIHVIRERALGGAEIDGPGRRAPGISFSAHGISLMQGEYGWWREYPRLREKSRSLLTSPGQVESENSGRAGATSKEPGSRAGALRERPASKMQPFHDCQPSAEMVRNCRNEGVWIGNPRINCNSRVFPCQGDEGVQEKHAYCRWLCRRRTLTVA